MVVVGVQVAEHQVGVGHRGLVAALAVTRRTGRGACAARADRQPGVGIVAGDRAAAGAHGLDVHHRHLDQPAVDDRVELVEAHGALDHDPDVEGGPAHVGGHDLVELEAVGHVARSIKAGDGACVNGLERSRTRQAPHAAGVVHQLDRAAVAHPAQLVAQVGHAVAGVAVQVGIEDRGHRAHVLAGALGDLVAEDHREAAQIGARELLLDHLAHHDLVVGVLEGPEEADDEAAHALVDQVEHALAHLLAVDRHHDLAVAVHALAHPHDQLTRDQRHRAAAPSPGCVIPAWAGRHRRSGSGRSAPRPRSPSS